MRFSDALTVSFGDACEPRSTAPSGSGSPAARRRAASSCCSTAPRSRPSPRRTPSPWTTARAGTRSAPRGSTSRRSSRCARWRLAFAGDGASLDLELEALGAPFALEDDDAGRQARRDERLRAAAARARAAPSSAGRRVEHRRPRPARALVGRARLGRASGARATLGAWFPRRRAVGDGDRPGRLRRSRPRGAQRRRLRRTAPTSRTPRASSDPRAVDDVRRGRAPAPRRARAVDDRRRAGPPRRRRGRLRHDARPRPPAARLLRSWRWRMEGRVGVGPLRRATRADAA